MSDTHAFRDLDVSLDDLQNPIDWEVVEQLPFGLDDYSDVNECYWRWREHRDDTDRQALITWLFAFCRRHMAVKWTVNSDLPITEIEKTITEAFTRCYDNLEEIAEGGSFASYVAVACKHAFINVLRRRQRQPQDSFTLIAHDRVGEVDLDFEIDHAMLDGALERAVGQLQPKMAAVVRMRFLDGLSYHEIAIRTGLSRNVVRKYAFRAIRRLREHPEIAFLFDEWTSE